MQNFACVFGHVPPRFRRSLETLLTPIQRRRLEPNLQQYKRSLEGLFSVIITGVEENLESGLRLTSVSLLYFDTCGPGTMETRMK